jgi:thiamine-monophosphate kinase
MTVGDVSERDLIARVQQRLAPPPAWLLVGIGDDAAVVEPERNRVEVLTVDALVDGVHFDRAFVPPDAIGHRALAVNLSDLASMGAAPRLALLSMALPLSLPIDDFDRIVSGFATLAARYGVHLVGGNLTHTPGPLTIDVTLVGTVKRRQAMTRGGARAGDELYVSGSVGGAAAGLLKLRHVNSQQWAVSGGAQTADCRLLQAYFRPEPRVRLGMLLARNRAATACVDLSDGLGDGVRRLAHDSGVGISVDADALPIGPEARAVFESTGCDAVAAAVAGGDDYELLFTVAPRTRHRLRAAQRHGDAPVTRIGVCTSDRDLVLRRGGAAEPVPEGYTHFGRSGGLRDR